MLIRTGHELNVHDLPDASGVGSPLDVALATLVEDRIGRGLKRSRVCANRRELEHGEQSE